MFSRRLNTALMVVILIAVGVTLAVIAITQPASPSMSSAPVVEQVHIVEQPTADEAFIADLFEGATDVTPEQVATLTELAKRYCTFVVEGQIVPGAEVQTREGYIETLTMPIASPTTGWSLDEANKFLDVAEGAYCPPV